MPKFVATASIAWIFAVAAAAATAAAWGKAATGVEEVGNGPYNSGESMNTFFQRFFETFRMSFNNEKRGKISCNSQDW